jgi:hypothetical protein
MRQAGMFVEIDDGRLRVGTELAGSGTEGIGRLERMPALNRLAAARTNAAVNVELPHDRLAGNFGLLLLIDVSFLNVAAAFGTGVGKRRFQLLVDVLRRRHGPMSMPGRAGVRVYGRVFSAALAANSWRTAQLGAWQCRNSLRLVQLPEQDTNLQQTC